MCPVELNQAARFDGEGPKRVEAEVIPEHITVKATIKVRKRIPNALCV